MMNILLLSPGYPADMPEFTRGLAEAGARVFGVGDSPVDGLPSMVCRSLAEYIPALSLWDEDAVISFLPVVSIGGPCPAEQEPGVRPPRSIGIDDVGRFPEVGGRVLRARQNLHNHCSGKLHTNQADNMLQCADNGDGCPSPVLRLCRLKL